MSGDPSTTSSASGDANTDEHVDSDDATASDPFERLWARVLEAWDDDRAHAALLQYAVRAGRLPDAAGRYRALFDDPDRGDKARRRIDAIMAAALQMLESIKTPPRVQIPISITLSFLAICAILLAWLGTIVFHR